MKKTVLSLLIIAVIASIVACGGKKQEIVKEEKPVAVTVALAQPRDISIEKSYSGSLEGIRQANIYASIPEAVVELPYGKGNRVEAGQPVILLDKNGVASQYKQAYAGFVNAKDNYEKMGKLFAQGAISEQTYNGVKTAFEVAQANYASARQQVELTTPISGVLTDLSVNVGDYVHLGVPLATIAQTDKMRMTIFVESRGASYINKGQDARVLVDLAGSTPYQSAGVVSEVSKSADPATRMFRVEIQIDNKENLLRPGMFAKASIIVNELKDVLVVPKESVYSIEGVFKTFKLEGDRAKEVTVTVGESTNGYYQITSGLNINDSVIVLGRTVVIDGSLVKVISDSLGASYSDSKQEG